MTVVFVVLGLEKSSIKPSEEGERKCVDITVIGIIITTIAVLTFCRACQPRFKVNRFFPFLRSSSPAWGEKTLRERLSLSRHSKAAVALIKTVKLSLYRSPIE